MYIGFQKYLFFVNPLYYLNTQILSRICCSVPFFTKSAQILSPLNATDSQILLLTVEFSFLFSHSVYFFFHLFLIFTILYFLYKTFRQKLLCLAKVKNIKNYSWELVRNHENVSIIPLTPYNHYFETMNLLLSLIMQ